MGGAGAHQITYTVYDYLDAVRQVRIVGDASPWGPGAYLVIYGTITSWYAARITSLDSEVLRTPAGVSSGQQVWEALNLLIALRIWSPQWQANRVRLEVRADNVTALTLITTMRGRGWALNTLAR